ncbi:MAG: NAD(P)/FAD-dependent oxidoreductase, partial [Saprospiraceae bacterium]|nr:NAD(P)/FAD-dependent oxidoreductase [Saprospiraceae bacterium]
MATHHQILIVGAGNAGISVAAQLLRADSKLNIGIIDPSETHYYQPAWTLVGGGVFNINKTARPQTSVIPTGAKWIKESVRTFEPENNLLTTDAGEYSYDYLVVCPGIQLDWNKIKGLPEALGKNGVTSNYSFTTAPYTFECLKNFKGGNAVFTDPGTPVKCGGAPHKV